jgi:uncharacterized phage protein gp47/JayE
MPFKLPSLTEISTEAQQDLAARLGAFGRLRRNTIDVLARVWAGMVHSIYGFISYLSKQLFPMTAEADYLDRQAAWWGIFRKGAAKALGQVTFSGTADSEVPAGAMLTSSEGHRYMTLEGGRLSEVGLTSRISAEEGGKASDLNPGVKLSLISPYSGVTPEATVGDEGVTGGADAETDKELRARLLERVQEPPQGGTAYDYVAWAKAVPGVTRAWAYGGRLGPGSVSVTFVCDGTDNIIPDSGKVAEVQAYLDDPVRRPITAEVVVYAPVAYVIDIAISDLSPNTEEVKKSVKSELVAMFVREAIPGGRILVSHIREAISQAKGEYDHVLVTPQSDQQPGIEGMPVLGDVTFD